eukprot:RCo030274
MTAVMNCFPALLALTCFWALTVSGLAVVHGHFSRYMKRSRAQVRPDPKEHIPSIYDLGHAYGNASSSECVAGIHIGHDRNLAVFNNGALALASSYSSINGLAEAVCSLPTACTLMGDSPLWTQRVSREAAALRQLCQRPILWIGGHHAAHAAYGFFTSPLRSALVLALDGGGDLQPLASSLYLASRSAGLQRVEVSNLSMGCLWFNLNRAARCRQKLAPSHSAGWPDQLMAHDMAEPQAKPEPSVLALQGEVNSFLEDCCRLGWVQYISRCPGRAK